MSSNEGEVVAGKKYYLMIHAYHHILCEVVAVLGPTRVQVKNVRWIYSCQRGWTLFFKEGCKEDTQFEVFPNSTVTFFAAFDWEHEIP